MAAERKQLSPSKRTIARWRSRGVAVFMVLMVVGSVAGLLFFARPTTSEIEQRTLTPFPEVTLTRVIDGTFFTDLSLWYADTYPAREPLIAANKHVTALYGIQPKTGMVGGNRVNEEIPDEGVRVEVPERPRNIDEPEMGLREEDLEDQIVNGMYTTEDAAYTLYYFDQGATQAYVDVVNDAAELLDGVANVYSIIVPTNGGVLLDADLTARLGVANQEQAIDYFYSLMSEKVTPIETFDILNAHKDEYLYFRTDHHWTQLAAYYVWYNFCITKGIEPPAYDTWEEWDNGDFLGAYAASYDITYLEDYPDRLIARVPTGTNSMLYWSDDEDPDTEREGMVIIDYRDVDDEIYSKYATFTCANAAMGFIENPNIHDGSACLIVKDSFGNPLASVMVDNYQYVWMLDFRYGAQDLRTFAITHGIQDVIIENAVMFAGTYDTVELVGKMVYNGVGRDRDAGAAYAVTPDGEASSKAAAGDAGEEGSTDEDADGEDSGEEDGDGGE